MQSSDGTQPWCPGQSLWCLIAEHITGSELPKIQAALGSTLVNQYRDIHAEVSGFSMSVEDDILALSFLDFLGKAGVLHTVFTCSPVNTVCSIYCTLCSVQDATNTPWLAIETLIAQTALTKKKRLSLGLRSDQSFAHSGAIQLMLFMNCADGGVFVSGLLWLHTLNNYNSLTP